MKLNRSGNRIDRRKSLRTVRVRVFCHRGSLPGEPVATRKGVDLLWEMFGKRFDDSPGERIDDFHLPFSFSFGREVASRAPNDAVPILKQSGNPRERLRCYFGAAEHLDRLSAVLLVQSLPVPKRWEFVPEKVGWNIRDDTLPFRVARIDVHADYGRLAVSNRADQSHYGFRIQRTFAAKNIGDNRRH